MRSKRSQRSTLLLLAAGISQLGACALVSRGETLQVRYFTLDDRAASHAPAPDSKTELSLRLGRVDASGGLGEQIAVRKGEHEISYREDQRWTERPAQFVRRELERALFSERGLLRSYSGHTPQLEVELIELELVETDQQVDARVRLTAQIRNDHRSLCHDNFETQLPIRSDARSAIDMEQSVAALSMALHQTVDQVATRAVQCLAAAPEASAARKPTAIRERREAAQPADSDGDSAAVANSEP